MIHKSLGVMINQKLFILSPLVTDNDASCRLLAKLEIEKSKGQVSFTGTQKHLRGKQCITILLLTILFTVLKCKIHNIQLKILLHCVKASLIFFSSQPINSHFSKNIEFIMDDF